MYNPILEKRIELIDNIQKSFEPAEDGIEKAKWQIGEVRVDSRGIAHECYEYTSDGKPRLRRVKKQKSDAQNTTQPQQKKKEVHNVMGKKDSTDNKNEQPKTLSEAQKGDTVAIVMERYNPQLGDYVVIKKGTITKKAKWGFTVDDGSGYEKTYDNDGDEKKAGNAIYGSVKYTIMTENEMNGKIKDNKFNGARISSNSFESKKE